MPLGRFIGRRRFLTASAVGAAAFASYGTLTMPVGRFVSRRRFFTATAAGVAGLGCYGFLIEPGRVSVSRHRIGRPGDAEHTLRLVQLSDLHLQQFGRHEAKVIKTVHRLTPELVVITGDAIDAGDKLPMLAEFLSRLPRGIPIVATLGNWEHWAGFRPSRLRDFYSEHGVELLVNRSVVLSHAGRPVTLTGLDDSTGGRPDLKQALKGAVPSANHILLAHSPAYRDHAADAEALFEYSPVCMLSGHTHGGQVNLLGWAPIRPPGSGRYVSGWYRDREPHLYVSRGIGTSQIRVRCGSPPEVTLFDWHLDAEQ